MPRDAQRVELLQAEIIDIRKDLALARDKRDRFATYGDSPIEVPNPTSTHFSLGLEVELEPFRFVLTGSQLAEQVDDEIQHIEDEIAWREKEVHALLSDKLRRNASMKAERR